MYYISCRFITKPEKTLFILDPFQFIEHHLYCSRVLSGSPRVRHLCPYKYFIGTRDLCQRCSLNSQCKTSQQFPGAVISRGFPQIIQNISFVIVYIYLLRIICIPYFYYGYVVIKIVILFSE